MHLKLRTKIKFFAVIAHTSHLVVRGLVPSKIFSQEILNALFLVCKVKMRYPADTVDTSSCTQTFPHY
jgi:hypothetical protein